MKKNPLPTEVILEDVPCPMGCRPDDINVLTGHDRLHDLPGKFSVVKCQSCGLMRTNPRPTPETIGFYYPSDYGPYQSTLVSDDGSDSLSLRAQKAARLIIRNNAQLIPKLATGRMLEIGCASGAYLHQMSKQGWQVEGIEFSESAAKQARAMGYSVTSGQLENVPDYTEPFELLVGWMVVEHLHEPLLALGKLYDWARPGGWLVISVPNAGSVEFRLFKERWYALHLPAHNSHFTPQTLEKLLSKAGWKVEKIFHQRTISNLLYSLNYWACDHHPDGLLSKLTGLLVRRQRVINLLFYPVICVLAYFGQTGRMTVWARKPQ